MSGTDIVRHPIHLGRGATAVIEPTFTGEMEWYQGYTSRHADDGREGRLVSMFTFTESWSMWEMHPNGSEVVLCTSGALTLHQEGPDGTRRKVPLLLASEVAHMEAEIAGWNGTLVKPQWPKSKHSAVDFDGQSLELFY